MTSRKFIALFLTAFAAFAMFIVIVNAYVDSYGLFRPAQGRLLTIYGEERIAKYLHSFRYIPENFDGVLLGSSVSSIFETRDFSGYRVYNASIQGGNVADIKPIAENIFRKRKLKLTLICIHRYITNDHDKKTDLITPKQYWGALGSPQLMISYVSRAANRLGIAHGRYDEYGALHSGPDPDGKAVQQRIDHTILGIKLGTERIGNYHVDPIALEELGKVVAIARSRSEQLVIFYPPMPAPIRKICWAEYSNYKQTIGSLLEREDVVVDFNDAPYEYIQNDLRNFTDAVHVSRTGAAVVMAELSKVVRQHDLNRTAMLH